MEAAHYIDGGIRRKPVRTPGLAEFRRSAYDSISDFIGFPGMIQNRRPGEMDLR
jgi:hypothetical protein